MNELPLCKIDREIEDLRRSGGDQFDPVQFHFLSVLARRTADNAPQVRQVLELKLVLALAAFQTRFAQAQSARNENGALAPPAPGPGPLGLLARQVAHHGFGRQVDRVMETPQPQPRHGLKSVGYFRTAWSRLNTDKQVAKALDQAPKNAGPINSHGLVLKSLALMRDASPHYLNRFVSHVETLLILDRYDRDKPVHALPRWPAKISKP